MYIVQFYNKEKQIVETPSEVVDICVEDMEAIEAIELCVVKDIRKDQSSYIQKALVCRTGYTHYIVIYSTEKELVDELISNVDELIELVLL